MKSASLFFQILMNAPSHLLMFALEQMTVRTQWVAIYASVIQASVGMEHSVKVVPPAVVSGIVSMHVTCYMTGYYVHADVDECRVGISNDCHGNADCINTYGSHECRCKTGYEGNGFINCTGMYIYMNRAQGDSQGRLGCKILPCSLFIYIYIFIYRCE